MTATVTRAPRPPAGGVGRIARVIGPVVDIEFPTDAMPAIYNALTCEFELTGEKKSIILEVAQHIGDGMVRAISMKPTDGLVRGGQVTDTGESDHRARSATSPSARCSTPPVTCLNLEEGETLDVKRAVGHPPQGAGVRPARVEDPDVRDRHQGHRPARRRTSRAARSACSVVPVWARPC